MALAEHKTDQDKQQRSKRWLAKMFQPQKGVLVPFAQEGFENDEDGVVYRVNNETIITFCNNLLPSTLMRHNVMTSLVIETYEQFIAKCFTEQHVQAMKESEQVHTLFVQEVTNISHKIFKTRPQKTLYQRWFDLFFPRMVFFKSVDEAWPMLKHIRNKNVMKHYTWMLIDHVLSRRASQRYDNPNALQHTINPIVLHCKAIPRNDTRTLAAQVFYNRNRNNNVKSSPAQLFYFSDVPTQMYLDAVLTHPFIEEGNVVNSSMVKQELFRWFKQSIQTDDVDFFTYYWQTFMRVQQSQMETKSVPNEILKLCTRCGSINIIRRIRDDMRLLPNTFPTQEHLRLAAIYCRRIEFFKWIETCNPYNDQKIQDYSWKLSVFRTFVQQSSFDICCHVLSYFAKFIAQINSCNDTTLSNTKRNIDINRQTLLINEWKTILKVILERMSQQEEQFHELFVTIIVFHQNISRTNLLDTNFINECKNKSLWFQSFAQRLVLS